MQRGNLLIQPQQALLGNPVSLLLTLIRSELPTSVETAIGRKNSGDGITISRFETSIKLASKGEQSYQWHFTQSAVVLEEQLKL
jgi:hypothetical protein